VQREIQQAAFEYQQRVERGEQVVVGVNRYAVEGGASPAILRIDSDIERGQVDRLRNLRARRNAGRVSASLKRVEEVARSSDNLMPAILDAVKAYATVGEISDTLRRVFGEYQESVVI